MDQLTSMTDHDLLVRLDEKMNATRNEIKEVRDGMNTKVNDHEGRIKAIETSLTQQAASTETKAKLSTSAKAIIAIAISIVGIVEPFVIIYLTRQG